MISECKNQHMFLPGIVANLETVSVLIPATAGYLSAQTADAYSSLRTAVLILLLVAPVF